MARRIEKPTDLYEPDEAWYARWRERFKAEGRTPEQVERQVQSLLMARRSWK